MADLFYQDHVLVMKWKEDYEIRCQDHFIWLEEVIKVAADNYQRSDVDVLPKTPSVKKRIRKRKPPIVLISEDDDFEDIVPISKIGGKEVPSENNVLIDSSMEAEVIVGKVRSRSTRSTRNSVKSEKATRSARSSKSNRSSKNKKVVYSDDNSDSNLDTGSCQSQASNASMESIEEVEEIESKPPIMALFRCSEPLCLDATVGKSEVAAPEPDNEMDKSVTIQTFVAASSDFGSRPKPSTSADNNIVSEASYLNQNGSIDKCMQQNTPSTEANSKCLSKPLSLLKKTLTPISPKVRMERVMLSDENVTSSEVDVDTGDSADHDSSFAGANVKEKVRAYNNLIHKQSPANKANKDIIEKLSVISSPGALYTSRLNVTLSSERLPAKARVVRQLSNSSHVNSSKKSESHKSSFLVSRRSSLAKERKSTRLSQKASRMSLAKRKSFIIKNRTSIIVDADKECENRVSKSSTPKPASYAAAQSPLRTSCRKRHLATDSDSSHSGTNCLAEKRVKSEKCLQSARVQSLKYPGSKSSDSEYVTDDSDWPITPDSKQKKPRKSPGPTRANASSSQRTTPRSPISGSFIQRNTPKATTLLERQELYKKELKNKRAKEERRLEKMRIQRIQEVEEQKRRREERHQQVLQKRLAQQKMAMELSLSSVKSKEKRGSVIIKEQREKAEQERQKRARKQAEAEERRRQDEERRLQKIREKEEESRMIQAMMHRKREYEDQERQRKIQEEKQQADEKRREQEREMELQAQKQREQEAASSAATAAAAPVQVSNHNTSLNSTLNRSIVDSGKNELQSYNIDDIHSDDETDDEEAPKKEIPPWASGHRMKATMIHQHYKPPNIDEIFPPAVLLLAPDLSVIFPKQRARFNKRTSSAVWSPIHKHFLKNFA